MAYLAVSEESPRRDSLINLLWPHYTQTRARAALRQCLYTLNKSLPGPWLNVDGETISLNPDPDLYMDLNHFQGLIEECKTHPHPEIKVCPDCLSPLTEAVRLYRDDFLSGFSLKDSLNFDDWQFFQAEESRTELAGVLERLVKCHSIRAEHKPAIVYARRWLSIDRLHEPAHYGLIRLYASNGQRSNALEQYKECEKILRERLGVTPRKPTTELYEAIKEDRFEPGPVDGYQIGVLTVDSSLEDSPSSESREVLVEEENRLVTVLNVNMEVSIDEESQLNSPLRVIKDVIAKYGGQVDTFIGKSVLGIFGREGIKENDPEIALRAGLQIREEVQRLGFKVSLGINTGGVYFRRTSRRDEASTLMGEVANLALRLAGEAEGGSILVGESTYRHTRDAFDFTPLSLKIKGIDGSVASYKVERLLPQPKKTRGLEDLRAPMIGREREFEDLKIVAHRWLGGKGGMVSIIGEAGIGKSRLVAELKFHLQNNSSIRNPKSEIVWLEGRCLESGMTAGYQDFRKLGELIAVRDSQLKELSIV